MGLLRHPSKYTGRLRTLLLALSLLPGVVINLDEQAKVLRPSRYACPVITNLFPMQERLDSTLKFIFPENEVEVSADKVGDLLKVVQRISITILTSDGAYIEIPFKWKGVALKNFSVNWGERTGVFWTKGDGKPNCFYLGPYAGLPVNIPCAEFSLAIPPDVEVKDVSFSNEGGEYISEDCPMPELERQIGEAYEDSRRTPQDEAKSKRFISLLEKAIPEYGCISESEGYPVPALFLVDLDSIWKWINHLYLKVDETNEYALRVFAGVFDIIKEGVLAEVMDHQIWRVLHDKPLFILKNWGGIKNYRRTILESRWLQTPESNTEMVEIYRDIALKEPKYKSACEEIISILSEKSNAYYEVILGHR